MNEALAVVFLEAFEAENMLNERASLGIECSDAEYFDAACKTSRAALEFRLSLAANQMSETTAQALGWPHGYGFKVHEDNPADPHATRWYLVMPGGGSLPFNHCAEHPMDEARVRWIADACNAALTTQAPADETETAHRKLDEAGVPRVDTCEAVFSLWGRVLQFKKAAAPTPVEPARPTLQQSVYMWLGQWRDQMQPRAVMDLQNILGPLAVEPGNPATQTAGAIEWPKSRSVKSRTDMHPTDSLQVGLDNDNDVMVSLWTSEAGYSSVEFCNPGGGGGRCPNTRRALIALMVAMEQDGAGSVDGDPAKGDGA